MAGERGGEMELAVKLELGLGGEEGWDARKLEGVK